MSAGETSADTEDHGSSRRVSRGLMQALEQRRLAPGQRLVETELARQFGVGRNAVREAIQWLAAHGVIDVTRHRSAAIRRLDAEEAQEVLEVAAAVMGLAARRAAARYRADEHRARLDAALLELDAAAEEDAPGAHARARRHLHRTLLEIGSSRELKRLFPALGLPILFAQHDGARLRRLMDAQGLVAAVAAGEPDGAEAAGRRYVEGAREALAEPVARGRA